MKAVLKLFGKDLAVQRGSVELRSETMITKSGAGTTQTPYTQSYYVYELKDGRVVRLTGDHRKPLRDDVPNEVRGMETGNKAIRVQAGHDASPADAGLAIFEDGTKEIVVVTVSKKPYDKKREKRARTARANGRKSLGRPSEVEGVVIRRAVKFVRERTHAGVSLSRACELAQTDKEVLWPLSIDALESYVRAARRVTK